MKISKQTAPHYIWGSRCDGWHLVQQENLSIIHEHMPPGTQEVRHYHSRARQFFFVLTGVATMEVQGELITLYPHEGIEIPPRVSHQMINRSSEAVEFLVISQPTTRGDRVEFPGFNPKKF
ncbi:cupin domain-containing protein [Laceyella putida]|uniref:Cupin domain-containing protein n=1 Tax=Laceyella putida TaxID=110101 RepID=A0ABW2RQ67_9BACL